MTQTPLVHSHSGWREEEVRLLFQAVQESAQNGRPLRDVFADVAQTLHRKPNSIRNFYYARVRELPDTGQRKAPFRTFDQDELHSLLRTVLIARGNGDSVRACVTQMAKGDRALMLRYQNKYRSILKNKPEMLEAIAQSLRAEGKPCPTQSFTLRRPTGGRHLASLFEEASRLSQEVDDDSLSLLLERLLLLLERTKRAEQQARRAQTQEFSMQAPGNSFAAPSQDLAITVTDLREEAPAYEMDFPLGEEGPQQEDATGRWLEARREADRLKVQLDLLKIHLEDLEKSHAERWGSLRGLIHGFLSLPQAQREETLETFVHQAGEALQGLEAEPEW